ncbi:MAG: orotate phosphoribosyltransferase [Candidatus Thermoplasmatota archaeon]|nr:orotate phosphoribosyltransferase [Candidatus Thermoplasmatota archaeon]
MEMAGLCAVCGAPGVMHTCGHCGSHVCPRHYQARSGLCTVCAGGLRFGKNK